MVSRNGFTLIEIIMVIVIIGIIAAVSIPAFVNLQNEAKQKSELSIIGAVKSGIHNYYAESLTLSRLPRYPVVLDNATNGPVSGSNQFFTNVLSMSALYDWQKTGLAYAGPTSTVYTYNPSTGTFESDVNLLYSWRSEERRVGKEC